MLFAIAGTPVDQLHNECMAQKETARTSACIKRDRAGLISVARRLKRGIHLVHAAYKREEKYLFGFNTGDQAAWRPGSIGLFGPGVITGALMGLY
jgi:hypothetical protein